MISIVTGAASGIGRALSERLYLIGRRDASAASASGLLTLRAEFAVLGSTGNVYNVAICRLPSCTCVDHLERKTVCKHLLFVYHKVAYHTHTYHTHTLLTTLRTPHTTRHPPPPPHHPPPTTTT